MPVNPNQATDFAGSRVVFDSWTPAITECVGADVGRPSRSAGSALIDARMLATVGGGGHGDRG